MLSWNESGEEECFSCCVSSVGGNLFWKMLADASKKKSLGLRSYLGYILLWMGFSFFYVFLFDIDLDRITETLGWNSAYAVALLLGSLGACVCLFLWNKNKNTTYQGISAILADRLPQRTRGSCPQQKIKVNIEYTRERGSIDEQKVSIDWMYSLWYFSSRHCEIQLRMFGEFCWIEFFLISSARWCTFLFNGTMSSFLALRGKKKAAIK